MTAFQRYAAILDIDGNSWSSRFGSLLCYNSVVLKVEPEFVDYFHFQQESDGSGNDTTTRRMALRPWTHYVPVRYDLEDLPERAAWVLNNATAAQRIRQAANAWCRQHLTHAQLARDYLDIWQAYVEYLDKADPEWSNSSDWRSAKRAMFAARSEYKMIPAVVSDRRVDEMAY